MASFHFAVFCNQIPLVRQNVTAMNWFPGNGSSFPLSTDGAGEDNLEEADEAQRIRMLKVALFYLCMKQHQRELKFSFLLQIC